MISDDFQIGPNGAYEHVGNELDLQYQDLLQHILDNGVEKKDRTGTGTKSIFGYQIRHNMQDGFPLLTTKKVHFKSVVTELLWFLRGDTNIKYLVDNNCHIWDGDAYKNYCMSYKDGHEFYEDETVKRSYTQEEFINKIKTDDEFAKKWGELGPIYGKQWRKWNCLNEGFVNLKEGEEIEVDLNCINISHQVDQIANLISELKTNPDSRRLMVNAWNVGELDQMVLPPCHYGFQVYTRELSLEERCDEYIKRHPKETNDGVLNYKWIGDNLCTHEDYDKWNIPTRAISLMWNQRSVDTFLGLPFNIASYGLLLEIIAKEVNMIPDELIGNLGDVHLYLNHIEQAKEQISRTPYELPKLIIEHSSLEPVELVHKLENYQSHPAIKAPLSN
jgi:thymidylate synthase